ncbi:MAG: TonB-system energizer ExbB [Desulfobacteraceae bacterium]|nr:TonB-system energizer ExbB [Desulfobacteraceae bacterium]
MEWLKRSIDYGIIGFLIFLSIIALAIAVERLLIYRRIRVEHFKDKRTLELHLSNKLHIIASIGSNAPYIGLLGTVLGIMVIFYHMGTAGFMDTEAIMVGLALALKATAVGLVVAIPSIVIYNLLLRKVKVILVQWEIAHG